MLTAPLEAVPEALAVLGAHLEVRDDLNTGLAHLAWPGVPFTACNTTDGLTRPALAR